MPDAARPLRFALAGVRHFHIFDLVAALAARDDTELVAAAEDDAAAAAAAHARGVEFTHRTVDELLAEPEQFDVLAVGDYYARRGSLAIRALELGKHVLLDKPICIDLAELDRIAALSRGRGTPVVGCMLGNRGNGNLRQMRALLAEGAIGTVHTVTFLAQHPLNLGQRPGWYFEPGKHGGTINDIAIHAFDVLPWLLGRAPRRLLAARCWNGRLPQHPHFQVAAQMMLELDGGIGVLGDLSYLGPEGQGYRVPQYWRFTVHGDGGLAETAVQDNAVRLWRGGAESGELFAPLAAAPHCYLDDFLTEIAGGAPRVLGSGDVLSASRWALQAQHAADHHRFNAAL